MKTNSYTYKQKMGTLLKLHWKYLLPLFFVFILIQGKVYKPSIDLNGDNATYYAYAKSIYKGYGYSNIMSPEKKAVNNFPPGYPLLMATVMHISKSFTAQKIFNSIMLGASCLLIYFLVFRFSNDKLFALIGALLPTLNYLVLHFSTMMMSEMSFLFFSMVAIYAAYKLGNKNTLRSIFTDKFFYLMLFSASYSYHIRTQGIALVVALFFYLFIQKKWWYGISYIIGFFLCSLPWTLRNSFLGLKSNRYLEQMLAVNHWRPEEGLMTVNQMFDRMVDTTLMLITKAIPNSVLPNYVVNYSTPASFIMYIVGILVLFLIIYGFFKYLRKDAWLIILYMVFSCGIITLWSAPSGNRYLVTIMPLMQIGLLFGLVALITKIYSLIVKKNAPNFKIVLILICLLSVVSFSKDINKLGLENKQPLPPAYANFFTIAKSINKTFPKGNVMVANRKPTLFYLFSGCNNTYFASSLDDKVVIADLLKQNVDFVVLDQLGYSSTYRYLVPAIEKNQDLFKVVMHLKNPDTFLLQFDKEKAKQRKR